MQPIDWSDTIEKLETVETTYLTGDMKTLADLLMPDMEE